MLLPDGLGAGGGRLPGPGKDGWRLAEGDAGDLQQRAARHTQSSPLAFTRQLAATKSEYFVLKHNFIEMYKVNMYSGCCA